MYLDGPRILSVAVSPLRVGGDSANERSKPWMIDFDREGKLNGTTSSYIPTSGSIWGNHGSLSSFGDVARGSEAELTGVTFSGGDREESGRSFGLDWLYAVSVSLG